MTKYRTRNYRPTNDLRSYGFVRTRAGRWIDPVTSKSLLTIEAWAAVNSRTPFENVAEWRRMDAAGLEWFRSFGYLDTHEFVEPIVSDVIVLP